MIWMATWLIKGSEKKSYENTAPDIFTSNYDRSPQNAVRSSEISLSALITWKWNCFIALKLSTCPTFCLFIPLFAWVPQSWHLQQTLCSASARWTGQQDRLLSCLSQGVLIYCLRHTFGVSIQTRMRHLDFKGWSWTSLEGAIKERDGRSMVFGCQLCH